MRAFWLVALLDLVPCVVIGQSSSGSRAAAGIYLIRMQAGSHDLKRKVLLAR
jgi:hypothetical protein